MRNMYHSDGNTDLAKMRDDAQKSITGDWYHEPESVLIHLHPFAEECKYGLVLHGKQVQAHEEYFVKKEDIADAISSGEANS